ncbi:MAG: energy-coupling factor transporter transmembrane component T family protein, partial [Promethearchaeota archaeon]
MFEYTHSNSIIHELDPRTKLIYSACMLIPVILIYSLPVLLFLLIIACFVWISAKIPLNKQKNVIKFIVFITVICFGTQIFFYTEMPIYSGPKTVLIELLPVEIPILRKLTITVEGLFHSLILTLKLTILFFSSMIIIYTTHPSEIMLVLR